ncbi:unnamed protein product [Effrenium voratum]|nr:unnamed protein product [Effrenium voratum]
MGDFIFVRAAKALDAGEEVTDGYISVLQPAPERRRAIKHYGFELHDDRIFVEEALFAEESIVQRLLAQIDVADTPEALARIVREAEALVEDRMLSLASAEGKLEAAAQRLGIALQRVLLGSLAMPAQVAVGCCQLELGAFSEAARSFGRCCWLLEVTCELLEDAVELCLNATEPLELRALEIAVSGCLLDLRGAGGGVGGRLLLPLPAHAKVRLAKDRRSLRAKFPRDEKGLAAWLVESWSRTRASASPAGTLKPGQRSPQLRGGGKDVLWLQATPSFLAYTGISERPFREKALGRCDGRWAVVQRIWNFAKRHRKKLLAGIVGVGGAGLYYFLSLGMELKR